LSPAHNSSKPPPATKDDNDAVKSENEDVDADIPNASPLDQTDSASDVKSTDRGIRRTSGSDEDEEDDLPVRKKRRTVPTRANGNSSPTNIKSLNKPPARIPLDSKPAPSKKVKVEKDDDATAAAEKKLAIISGDEEDIPVRGRKSKAAQARPGVKVKNEAKSPPPPGKEDPIPDQDEDIVDEDDDVKPEDAAKVREKVLAALKGSAKDAYPDWKAGDPVPYAALCKTFHRIEMTTKRLEILAHCSLFLRQVLRLTPSDLLETVLLMLSKLGADYTGIELGIGESLIMKAIGESTGRSLAVIKADQNETGDLGMVAAKSRANQPTMFKPKPLTVKAVFKGLSDIAIIEGQGSQTRKIAGIKKLLSAADVESAGKGVKIDITKDKGGPSEAKYIVRTLEGKLRLGLADKSVLVAVAQAVIFHRTDYAAGLEGKKPTPPTAESLAKGESIMKSVYR
jgi:DNA ligase-1